MVKVKTFHGERKTHEIWVDITSRVEVLKTHLTKLDKEKANYHRMHFIYPMGVLQRLPFDQTFEELNIPHNATIIFFGQKSFNWDLLLKGANITLLNNNLTVTKRREQSY